MLHKMFGSILGLYPLDTSNNSPLQPQSCDNQKFLQTSPNVPCVVKLSWLRTTGINNDKVRQEIIHIEKEENMGVNTKEIVSILNTKNIKSRETGES